MWFGTHLWFTLAEHYFTLTSNLAPTPLAADRVSSRFSPKPCESGGSSRGWRRRKARRGGNSWSRTRSKGGGWKTWFTGRQRVWSRHQSDVLIAGSDCGVSHNLVSIFFTHYFYTLLHRFKGAKSYLQKSIFGTHFAINPSGFACLFSHMFAVKSKCGVRLLAL